MKWVRENIGKVCLIAAVVFFLVTASLSSYRIGNDDDNDSVFELAAQHLTADVHSPLSGVLHNVSGFFGDLVHFRQYAKENEKLKQENDNLRQALSESQMSQEQLQQLEQLSAALSYTDQLSAYRKVTADVISLDQSGVYGTLTISAGSRQGIRKGDVVAGPEGMVGRVLSVTKKSAKVSGIINSSISVSFYVQGNEKMIGVVRGDGKGELTGYLLDNGKKISEGDILMTSGLGRYPAGIQIGTVTSVNKDKTTSQVYIHADPSFDFYSAGIVTVLVEEEKG